VFAGKHHDRVLFISGGIAAFFSRAWCIAACRLAGKVNCEAKKLNAGL
jgi:hypothetical protein